MLTAPLRSFVNSMAAAIREEGCSNAAAASGVCSWFWPQPTLEAGSTSYSRSSMVQCAKGKVAFSIDDDTKALIC